MNKDGEWFELSDLGGRLVRRMPVAAPEVAHTGSERRDRAVAYRESLHAATMAGDVDVRQCTVLGSLSDFPYVVHRVVPCVD